MNIRPERETDAAAVSAVNDAAFDTPTESGIVNALRQSAHPFVSLVAVDDSEVVGHIAFSPARLAGAAGLEVMGLAPMAVTPSRQRQGIGSALVAAGLEACKSLGVGAVVVLGHPAYYPRFGFEPASRFGLVCAYDAPAEAFMAIELEPGCLDGVAGLVEYHAAFADA